MFFRTLRLPKSPFTGREQFFVFELRGTEPADETYRKITNVMKLEGTWPHLVRSHHPNSGYFLPRPQSLAKCPGYFEESLFLVDLGFQSVSSLCNYGQIIRLKTFLSRG